CHSAVMSRYRRPRIEGGIFFLTVTLLDRSSELLVQHVEIQGRFGEQSIQVDRVLNGKIDRLLSHHNALRRGLGLEPLGASAIKDQLAGVAPRVLPYMDSVWSLLDRKRREGKRILFE